MSMFKRQPKALGDVLGKFLDQYPHKKKLRQGMAIHQWANIVGETIAENTKSLKFEGNRLVIKMSSSVWRHEVHSQRYTIMGKVNKKVGDTIVEDIIVRE